MVSRAENPELYAAQGRRWRENNREKARELGMLGKMRRRARIKAAPINDFTPAQWREVMAAYGNRCVYCGANGKLTIDHVVPIAKGGAHSIGNIVPACFRCNNRKKDRLPDTPVQLHLGTTKR
jgi:5-methylcytosine-specific restriction endonuclease McrA